jgi:hypothetical protein
MKISKPGFPKESHYIFIMMILFLLFVINNSLIAQEPPPRPVEVTSTGQSLSFGAFCHGSSGGTVTVNSGGSRSASGDVILLNMGFSFSTALFHLVANAGTVISILNGPDILLNGSNGGTMTLHIGNSNPLSPFVIATDPPDYSILNVGGTLSVSNSVSNPTGNYSGTFEIIFVQE